MKALTRRKTKPPSPVEAKVDPVVLDPDLPYRQLVHSLPVAVYATDAKGRITLFNEAAADLWGQRPVLGRDLWCGSYQIRREDGTLVPLDACPMAICLKEARPVRGEEVIIVRPDGSHRYVLPHPEPVIDAVGRLLGAVNMLVDITEHRRAEQSVRESEERLRLATQSGKVGIWDWDILANRVSWTDSLYKIHGIRPGEYDGTVEGFAKFVHPDDLEIVQNAIQAALAGEREYEIEFRAVKPNGEISWLFTNATVLREGGRPVRMLGATFDSTDLHLAEQAVRDNEQRLRLATQTGKVGIWDWDIVNDVVTWTDSLYDLYKVDRAGFDGSVAGFASFVHPEDKEYVQSRIEAALRGEPYEVEFRGLRTDGEIAWVFANASVFFEEGRPVRMLGATFESTDLHRAQEALEQSEARFRTLASHAPVGIFLCDPSGGCLYVNETWCDFTGLTFEEASGDRWAGALHPDDRERVAREWSEFTEIGNRFESEYRFRGPDGRVTWVHGSAVPHRSPGGELIGYIGSVVSITERVEAERALREADRRKDEFIAMLAHELRNPLGPIRNGVELLRRLPPEDPNIGKVREMIDRQANHMSRIVDDLLDVSRITRGKIVLRKEALDLATVIESTLNDYRHSFDEAEVVLHWNQLVDHARVEGDPTRLAQVIGNLIHNALKFTPAGGQVDVDLDASNGSAVLRVRDTGAGIEPEVLRRLFEPFSQAAQTGDRERGGLGLGLALVKGLITLHGGSVEARSEGTGKGAEFVVTLPLQGSPIEVVPHREEGQLARAPGLNVWVVEDNADAAESLRLLLELGGHTVSVARTGMEAFDLPVERRPDAIICDIGLPVMDGHRLCEELRRRPGWDTICYIALSGYGQEEDVRHSREAGFNYHLTKPADLHKLDEILRALA